MGTAQHTAPDLMTRAAGPIQWVADALGVYSRAAVAVARVISVVAVCLIMLTLAGNVFTRNVPGFSLFSSEELARFAFLWSIWMGVSIAVSRGDVTVISFVSSRGPGWWQRSVGTFTGLVLAGLLIYTCVRASEYPLSTSWELQRAQALDISLYYPLVSMAVGYYFITLHYGHRFMRAAARGLAHGRSALPDMITGLVGAIVIGMVLWSVCWALLSFTGISPLVVLGIMFVFLTLAGMPIVFMLSIVGIAAFHPSFFGLEFFPSPDLLVPFTTTQGAMGLSGGGELLVIIMFLVVAEVLNASRLSERLIAHAASIVGHLRGGMAYVCQLTSAIASGISGSAQADAAIMAPLLVPAMEKEGYRRDVAAAVVAGASIKGAIGPLSVMFIVYGSVVSGVGSASISKLLLSGVLAEVLLLIFQAITVYIIVRRSNMLPTRKFAGMKKVVSTGVGALPALLIPFIVLGGIFSGVFTPTESAAVAAVVAIGMALFVYASVSPMQLPATIVMAAVEAGVVMLLLGDSVIVAKALFFGGFGDFLTDFLTGLTSNKYVFLFVVNILLLVVGIFVEPLPALFVFAPFLAPLAVGVYDIDPVHFGLIVVFNLVLGLIHPPIGLVVFLVSNVSKVPIERLSITILPWLAVSVFVLFLVTYLPTSVVLLLSDLVH